MAWSSIIGQERAKRLLHAAWQSREIPGAYLLYGVEGVGKDALALEFAALLNCTSPSDAGSCGVCPSCKRAAVLQHPNIKFICSLPLGKNEDARKDDPISKLESDALQSVKDELQKKGADPYHAISIPKAREIKLSSIRDIKKELSLGASGGTRAIIISRADEMNTQSQNALLKTLEEPPARSVFLLTTSARHKLKPTILSRCQLLRCDTLRVYDITDALVSKAGIERPIAEASAPLGNGSYAAALRHTSEEYAAMRSKAVDFLRAVVMNKYDVIYPMLDEMGRARDRNAVEEFLSALIVWFRDAEALRAGATATLMTNDESGALKRFAERYHDTNTFGAVKRLEQATTEVRQNVNIALILRTLAADLRQTLA